MNIAVFGWYHHRNAGDDRLQYCITRWLDGHTLAFLPAGRPPSVALLRTYDAVLIGGGGLIMNHGGVLRDMAGWVQAIRVPVGLLGVSIEALSDTLRGELRALLDWCSFAWFRDRGSLEALGEHPRAFVAPDLTWLYPLPLLPASPANHAALCLRRHGGLDVDAWRRAIDRLGRPVTPWPLYFEGGGDTDPLRQVLPETAVLDEFSIDPLKPATEVISMRYHGVVFGLQTGRPSLAVGHQPKLVRFMNEHALAEWRLDEGAIDMLPPLLERLDRRRPQVLDQLHALRDTLLTSASRAAELSRDRLLTAADRARRARPRWDRHIRAFLDSRAVL